MSSSHRASRAERAELSDLPTRRTTGGSHRGNHAAPRDHATARKAIKTATITGGLASLATAAVVGGGVLSAGSPVMDAVQPMPFPAMQKILDDAAIIPDFWPVEHRLIKPCVKNYPETSMTIPKYRYIEIDPKAR